MTRNPGWIVRVSMARKRWTSRAALLLIWIVATPASVAATPDAYLNRLAGAWSMTGTVMGQPASYAAEGRWQLGAAWMRLAMTDVARPPGYDAQVYFGFDTKAGDYVVHWLDQFGAAGARVVGTGRRTGDTLVFTFPYANGEFRDILWLSANGRSGTLRLESKQPDGQWKEFANYQLKRRVP